MRTDPARSSLRLRAVAAALAALGAGASLAGCPGTLDDKGAFLHPDGSDCPDVPSTIFIPNCATAPGCHSAADRMQGLDLASPNVAARVVNQPAKECVPGILADPANPSQSILYLKLFQPAPCGSQMPLGADPLSDTQIACVETWIQDQGAGGSGVGGSGGAGGATGVGGAAQSGSGGAGGAGGTAAGGGGAGGLGGTAPTGGGGSASSGAASASGGAGLGGASATGTSGGAGRGGAGGGGGA
ncbi:MAG TPA: hypothetical protein VGM56_04685 [Byssovorax sp.]|jgi:hypothetical protein